MIKKFIVESKEKGYNDEQIKNALLDAGYDSEFVEHELKKNSYWWVVLIFLIVVFGVMLILFLDDGCVVDSECSSESCANGKCVVNNGMMNCQAVQCEEGFECYKCITASAGI